MIPFTITNKKEQATKLHQKYFHSYDTFYYNKQKRTKLLKIIIITIIGITIIKIIKNFLPKNIIIIKLTKYELKLIVGNRGIKNY